MFKQLIDGWRARRMCTAMGQANAYVLRDDWKNVGTWLRVAYGFSKTTKLHRKLLIDMILAWGMIGSALEAKGRTIDGSDCEEMAQMLQAKFDAGKYYVDLPGAKGFYDS
jgi:hypothetical protein